MILYELRGLNESDPVYSQQALSNYERQLSFLNSVVWAALESDRPFLSQTVIKALNYHAMACLHPYAGQYRPCSVTVGNYVPPDHYRVAALMDDFVNLVNLKWESLDAVELSAWVLWRLNWIHPFINGNGRTARAACYFVLCVKSGGLFSGSKILPVLLHQNRGDCIKAIESASAGKGVGDLKSLIARLLQAQVGS